MAVQSQTVFEISHYEKIRTKKDSMHARNAFDCIAFTDQRPLVFDIQVDHMINMIYQPDKSNFGVSRTN